MYLFFLNSIISILLFLLDVTVEVHQHLLRTQVELERGSFGCKQEPELEASVVVRTVCITVFRSGLVYVFLSKAV
jgi:hypothetical protein